MPYADSHRRIIELEDDNLLKETYTLLGHIECIIEKVAYTSLSEGFYMGAGTEVIAEWASELK